MCVCLYNIWWDKMKYYELNEPDQPHYTKEGRGKN